MLTFIIVMGTGILFDGGFGFFVFTWVSEEWPFVNTATVGLTCKVIGNWIKTFENVLEVIGSTGFERK